MFFYFKTHCKVGHPRPLFNLFLVLFKQFIRIKAKRDIKLLLVESV